MVRFVPNTASLPLVLTPSLLPQNLHLQEAQGPQEATQHRFSDVLSTQQCFDKWAARDQLILAKEKKN